jgi:regulatory protein
MRRATRQAGSATGQPGVVSAVATLRSRPGMVSVRVGKRRVATMPEDAATRLGVVPGVRWTSEMASAAEDALREAEARALAESLIARRPRSRRELAGHLARRGHVPAVVERVCGALARAGLLDDAAYARQIADSLLRRSPMGPAAIRARLVRRGVDARLAGDISREALAGTDQDAQALDLARRRARALPKGLDERARRRRLVGYLARRGFDPEIAFSAVDSALRSQGG